MADYLPGRETGLPASDSDHDVDMVDTRPLLPAHGQPKSISAYPDHEFPRSPSKRHELKCEDLSGSNTGEDLQEASYNEISRTTGEEVDEYKPSDLQLDTTLANSHYQQIVKNLQEETRLRQMLKGQLEKKDRQLSDHQNRTNSELEKKDKELEELRKRGRKLAGELSKIAVRANIAGGSPQLADQYLVDRIIALGISIRNFTIQHFEGGLKHELRINDSTYLREFVWPKSRSELHHVLDVLESQTWCASLIQETLWRVLCTLVFGKFPWAGKYHTDLCNLHRLLRPVAPTDENAPDPEAHRKFRIWSANTSTLCLERLDVQKETHVFERQILEEFFEALQPCVRSEAGAKQALLNIVRDAIKLDQELRRQVAKLTWVFQPGEFDASTMVLKDREPSEVGKNDLQLIVCPGLKKRGKSNGEDFNKEILLMPMEVLYVPVVTTPRDRSGRRG